jgi:hypothetical protein
MQCTKYIIFNSNMMPRVVPGFSPVDPGICGCHLKGVGPCRDIDYHCRSAISTSNILTVFATIVESSVSPKFELDEAKLKLEIS